ncbi:MAG TPA: ABC transporter substrate-binding protein [Candidatus Sulfotelmatobacter sp.]|nr:ABC transporter substrate-binding protein [Candidatus Sulfotelmatobacter sp.]
MTSILTSAHTPRRIVCLQPSATVILAAIGELDRVVACTKYCADVVPEVAGSSRAILADSWIANTDEIVAARPDLVIGAVPYQEKAVSEILKSGARFLGLAPKTLSDIYTDIATIAGATGAGQRGEEVIHSMQNHIEQVRTLTKNLPRPRVFCEEWGKPLIASQTWVAELVEAAGGEFVGEPGRQISFEDVGTLNPEVLIAAWCGAGNRVPLEKIIADRGWHETAAARAGRVFCIRDEYLNTPAPTLLQGLDALAFAIHPEYFPGTNVVSTKGIRQITAVLGSGPGSELGSELPTRSH